MWYKSKFQRSANNWRIINKKWPYVQECNRLYSIFKRLVKRLANLVRITPFLHNNIFFLFSLVVAVCSSYNLSHSQLEETQSGSTCIMSISRDMFGVPQLLLQLYAGTLPHKNVSGRICLNPHSGLCQKTDMFSIHWMTALHYVLNIFNWVNINAILATLTKASIQRFWQILDFLTKDFNGKHVLADQLPTMSSEMYLFFIIRSIIWLIKLLFHHLFVFNTG